MDWAHSLSQSKHALFSKFILRHRASGVIAEWLKKEGDVIKAGDVMAKVETDKATVDCACCLLRV